MPRDIDVVGVWHGTPYQVASVSNTADGVIVACGPAGRHTTYPKTGHRHTKDPSPGTSTWYDRQGPSDATPAQPRSSVSLLVMTAPLRVARLPPRRRRRLGLVMLVLLFALFLLLSNLVPLAAEWLWFQALGYERVFTTRLVAEAVLGVAVGGLVFAFLYANLRIAQRGLVPNPLVVQVSSGAAAVDVARLLRRLALPTALRLAPLFGIGAAGGWLGVLQFLHRTPFGATDPVFGREVSYYVFTLPVIAGAIGLGIAVTTLALLATIVLYVVRRDIVVFRRQVTVEPSARLHLAVLIALLFVLVALRVYFVRLPGLLYSTTGPLVGASYADLHAQLTGLRLAGLAAVASGALVLWGARSHRLARNTLLSVGLYFGVSLLGV